MQIARASSLSAWLGLDAAEGAVTRQAETPSVSRAVIRLEPSGRVGSTQAPSPAATRGARYLARPGEPGGGPEAHSFRRRRLARGGPRARPCSYPPGPGSPAELKNVIFSPTWFAGGPAQLCTSTR